MSHVLPYDETETWHSHPDLFMNEIEEILKTPDDSDFGDFIEVVLRNPDEIKGRARNFPFCLEKKLCNKNESRDYMKKLKLDTHTEKEVNL